MTAGGDFFATETMVCSRTGRTGRRCGQRNVRRRWRNDTRPPARNARTDARRGDFPLVCIHHSSHMCNISRICRMAGGHRSGTGVSIPDRQCARRDHRRNLGQKNPNRAPASRTRRFDPVGRYPISMLNSFPVAVIVGTALGFLAGLGIGGGSLLILWLTIALQMEQSTARCINLLFFLPAAFVSILFRRKQGDISPGHLYPAIIAGCISAAVFSLLSRVLDTQIIKKGFGVLLLFTGCRELFFQKKRSTG